MLKKQRAQFILDFLNKLYPETPVPLNHRNNFELLVREAQNYCDD